MCDYHNRSFLICKRKKTNRLRYGSENDRKRHGAIDLPDNKKSHLILAALAFSSKKTGVSSVIRAISGLGGGCLKGAQNQIVIKRQRNYLVDFSKKSP
jgi:hypothetical protein